MTFKKDPINVHENSFKCFSQSESNADLLKMNLQ